jgi:hypothetical protein
MTSCSASPDPDRQSHREVLVHIHQAGPLGRLIPVAQPHTAVALSWNSGSNALILALVELLLLVLLLTRWLVRRQGGRRRAWRRLRRQVRLTWGAFSEPVREFLQFRASVRQLTRLLASADPAAVAVAALDDVDTTVAFSAARDAYGFAARVEPATRRTAGEVAVHVAGRRVPTAAAPWAADGDDHIWYASAAEVERRATDPAGAEGALAEATAAETGESPAPAPRQRLLVPIGLHDEAVVLLDLLRGPGVLSTYGDRAAGRSFVQAVAAYLDLTGGQAEVIVTRGVHPRHDGPELDSVLSSLEGLAAERTGPVVVVCAAPDAEQSARLSRMAADGLLRAVVAGQVTGHRWEVRVSSRGRTETPALGIRTDAAPLGPAVARAARRSGVLRKGGAGQGAPRRRTDVPAPRTPRGPAPAPEIPGAHRPPTPGPATGVPATPASATGFRPAAPARGAGPAGPRPAPVPAAASAQPVPEPPAAAVRELFAEPEITGVSAADAREAVSYETAQPQQEESRNGS